MKHSFVTVAAIVTLLAACGGGDDAAEVTVEPASEPATGPTAITVPDATDDIEPVATTDAPAEPTVPATTAAPEPAPTTAPVPSGPDSCLDGEWLADAAAIQAQLDLIGSPIAFTVSPDSFNRAVLDHGTVVVDAEMGVGVEMPGTGIALAATATTHLEGTYTTADGVVTADIAVDDSELGDWSASLNGTPIELPAGVDLVEPPSAVTNFTGSTYVCTDTTLTFDVIDSPYGTITYTRVG